MKATWGVPVEEIRRGIKHGVGKINIDTDNRMALTGAIRKVLTENPSEFDPRKYLAPAMAAAMKKLCTECSEQFGTAGNAEKLKPLGGGDEEALHGALRAVRHGRQCREAEATAAVGNGQALQGRQPRPEIRADRAPTEFHADGVHRPPPHVCRPHRLIERNGEVE